MTYKEGRTLVQGMSICFSVRQATSASNTVKHKAHADLFLTGL